MSKIFTVNMPDIGEGVVEGEIVSWLKNPQDALRQDEPVVLLMTDKATVELPAPYPGKLVKQYYKVGEIAHLNKPLYDIEVSETTPTVQAEKKEPTQPTPKPQAEKSSAAPSTRRLAKELGIDIQSIAGTGPDGRVTNEDLARSHASNALQTHEMPLQLSDDEEVPIAGIRNLMAKKMTESHRVIPHFSYFEQVDATRLVQLRNSVKEEAAKQNISVTFMPFIIKALSLSLLRYPLFNSSVSSTKNTILIHHHHHVGIAVSTPHGLIVPVLKDVQNLSLQEIIMAYEELKDKAMHNKLSPQEMSGSTITVSNFGIIGGGGQWATPIINYPEVTILGIARIQKQPIVRNGVVVVRDILNLSWSFDHRIIDGDLAATFSHHFSTLLQNPAPLL